MKTNLKLKVIGTSEKRGILYATFKKMMYEIPFEIMEKYGYALNNFTNTVILNADILADCRIINRIGGKLCHI